MRGRHPLPLPEAVSRALRPLRSALSDLKSGRRTARRDAIRLLEGAITDLKLGMESRADAATGHLAGDLLRALGPQITVCEIEGARAILTLMLAALPPKIELEARS